MKREDVYKLIDGERDYQKFWDEQRVDEFRPRRDETMAVEAWLLWMHDYLRRAITAATDDTDKAAALANVRKVTALGVACMEYNETPARVIAEGKK